MNRKDVEALAQLLDGAPAGNGEVPDEVAALAALATAMEASAARPRAEFKSDLRAALVAEARQQATGPKPLLTRLRISVDDTVTRWKYSTRLAAASGATALALSGGGTAVAAEHALPGDALYPVKLVLEDVRMLAVRGEESRGERHLGYAERRADEAQVSAADGNDTGAARALREADSSARDGAGALIGSYQDTADRAPLRTLLVFSLAQRERVEQFSDLLGRDGREAAADHLVTLDRIEARIAVLLGGCPDCPDTFQPGVPPRADEGGFDFTRIPPAHEDFDPCPCPAPQAPAAPAPEPTSPATPPEDDEPVEPPAPDPDPGDDPPPPDEDEPILPLPDDAQDAVDEVRDTVDEILEELLEPLPVEPEDLPDLPLP